MEKFTFQWQDSLLVFCSKNLFPCVFVWWETPMWPINTCEKMGPEKWVWIIENLDYQGLDYQVRMYLVIQNLLFSFFLFAFLLQYYCIQLYIMESNIKRVFFFWLDGAEGEISSKTTNFTFGQKIEISCQIYGVPPVSEVVWFFGNISINDSRSNISGETSQTRFQFYLSLMVMFLKLFKNWV